MHHLNVLRSLVLGLVVGACGDARPATRMPLQADTVQFLTDDCPETPIPAVRMAREGEGLSFVDMQSGAAVAIMWPVGFAAWDVQGVATLHSTDGEVVAREGDVIGTIRAMPGVRPNALRVCAIAERPYR